jgi:hypothetical protein
VGLTGVFALSARVTSAQQRRSTFSVGVAQAQDGLPIPGAEVVLPELRLLARTDSLGLAQIVGVPIGVHRVRVRRLGFVPSDVQLQFNGDTTGAVFRLDPSPTVLPSVDVTADLVDAHLREFQTRRKQGIGHFLTETELGRDAGRAFMDVATVRFPGLTLKSDSDGRMHLASTRSACGATGTTDGVARAASRNSRIVGGGTGGSNTMSGSCESTRPCFVQVYLDNINLGESDDDLIRTWDLSGAEYYTGASMPAQYRVTGSACGVLLLWSKWR